MTRLKRYLFLIFTVNLVSGCVVPQNTYLAKEQEARVFKSDLEEIRRRYSKLKKQYQKLQQENKELKLSGKKLSATLEEVIAENKEADKEIKRHKKDKKRFNEMLSAKKDALSKTVSALMSDLDAIAVEKTAQQKELAGYKALVALRDAEIQDLKRKYNQKAEKILADLNMTQKQAQKVERKLAKTKAKLNVSQEKTHKIEQKLAVTKAKLEDLEKESGIYQELTKQMADEINKGKITITELKGKLTVSMLSQILFDSGSSTVKEEGLKVLKRVSDILSKVQNRNIRIEGHTDSDVIHGVLQQKYSTNWELSAARATNVVRYLVEEAEMNPGYIYAAAFGEHHPAVPNDTPENKAKNRRIEIVLVPR